MVTKSVRVEQLSGVELDYIVAFLEGAKNFDNSSGVMCFDLKGKKFFLSSNSEQKDRYSPSSDVSIGGEILFREMSQAFGKMLVKNKKSLMISLMSLVLNIKSVIGSGQKRLMVKLH